MPIEQSRDPQQFSDFERSGWDRNISGYDFSLRRGGTSDGTFHAGRGARDARHAGTGCMLWSRHAGGGRIGARR